MPSHAVMVNPSHSSDAKIAAITAALLALNEGEEGRAILGSVLNTPGITAVNSATHLASYSDAISNIPGIQQYFAESYEQTG